MNHSLFGLLRCADTLEFYIAVGTARVKFEATPSLDTSADAIMCLAKRKAVFVCRTEDRNRVCSRRRPHREECANFHQHCGRSIPMTAVPNRGWLFRHEKLHELRISHPLIEAAARPDPQGFLRLDQLPN